MKRIAHCIVGALLAAGVGCEKSNASFVDHLAIVNISPSHGAVRVGYDSTVVVTFSGALVADESGPTPLLPVGAACLTSLASPPASAADPCAGEGTVGTEVEYAPSALTVTLVPDEALLPDETYTVHLTPLLEGQDAGPLSAVVRASFRTIPTN